jgi:hypothetical protein
MSPKIRTKRIDVNGEKTFTPEGYWWFCCLRCGCAWQTCTEESVCIECGSDDIVVIEDDNGDFVYKGDLPDPDKLDKKN